MAEALTPQRVPVEERLFSLVLALLATENGLTKSEILSTVQGYRQRYAQHGNNAALERQFERDKDDIRELGVPLEAIDTPGEPGDNHSTRYRIPRGSYELPVDITFSPQEITLLALAGAVWREGSLSADSRRALIKLRSFGIEPTEPVIGYAPQLRTREASFPVLARAAGSHVLVSFPYLKPGQSQPSQRTVEPLAVVQHSSRWHLYAADQDAGATRTFLLSRIVGPVKVLSATPANIVRAGERSAADQAITELTAIEDANVAQLRVIPGSDAALRLGKRRRIGTESDDASRLQLHYTDVNVCADELASFGPEVFVEAPPALRAAVIDRLHAVNRAHLMAGDRP